MTLVDTDSKDSTVTEGFCSEFGLRILVGGLLHLEGTGGIAILYMGYIETNLIIQGLPQYNEDVLLVILDKNMGRGSLYK